MEHLAVAPFESNRSLSSYFSQCSKILISNLILVLLIILGWTVPQTIAATDIEISTTKSDNTVEISTLTVCSAISDYWNSSAYLSAVALCLTSSILPFAVVLCLGVVWVKPLYPSTRTKLILFVMLTAKFTLLSAFSDAIMIYSTYVDVKYDDVEIQITTSPGASFGVYVFTNLFVTVLAAVFFIFDQLYCYTAENKKYTENKHASFRILAFEYKPKSYLSVVILSLFCTLIVCNTWLLLESWYTVALRLNMKGVLSLILTDVDKVRSYSLIQIPSQILDTAQKGDATTLSLVFAYTGSTIVSSMALQFGMLVIWFIPVYGFKYFGWLVKFLLVGQSVNCFELYFVSCFLSAVEIDLFTKWEISNVELPKECADNDMVPQLFGSCFYVAGYFNVSGMLLVAAVIVIHWFTLYYTVYTAQKSGVTVIQFGAKKHNM